MLIHFLFDWAIPDILYIILHVQHRYRISGWSTRDTYWCCNPFQSIWNGIRICQGQRWRLRVLSNQEDTDAKPHCASHNSDPSNQCRKCMWRLGKCPGHCMFDPYNPLQRSLVVNNNKISRSSHKKHTYLFFYIFWFCECMCKPKGFRWIELILCFPWVLVDYCVPWYLMVIITESLTSSD